MLGVVWGFVVGFDFYFFFFKDFPRVAVRQLKLHPRSVGPRSAVPRHSKPCRARCSSPSLRSLGVAVPRSLVDEKLTEGATASGRPAENFAFWSHWCNLQARFLAACNPRVIEVILS